MPKNEFLIKLGELKDELDTAENHFNFASTPEQIDKAIFEMSMVEIKLFKLFDNHGLLK